MHDRKELMPKVLDAVANNSGPLKRVPALFGMGEATLFTWLRQSKDDPKNWLTEFEGEEMPFHIAFKRAQFASRVALRAKALDMVHNGERVPMFADGKPVWRVDPMVATHAETMTDLEWELTYGDRKRTDINARDEDGCFIQETQRLATNAHVLVAALRAFDPAFKEAGDININHRGGVWVMGGGSAPAQVLKAPEPVKLEHKPVDAEFEEVRENRASEVAADALNGSGADNPSAETIEEFPTEESAMHDSRMEFSDTDTPLERDVKERYWANRERVAAGEVPTPSAPVPTIAASAPDDDLPDTDAERAKPKAKPAIDNAALDQRIEEIRAKRDRGELMTAIERQIANAADRGSLGYCYRLLAPRPDTERVTVLAKSKRGSPAYADVRPGGVKVS